MKYYGKKEGERCYPLGYWQEKANENNQEIELYLAKPVSTKDGYFWCNHFQTVGHTKESCGKICPYYKPRNNKNGRCKYHSHCYEETNKKITIEPKGE